MDTTATTEYGTWADATSYHRPEDGIAEYLADQGDAYDAAAIAADYRAAIASALPEGVTLAGDQLYGPYPRPDDYAEQIDGAIDAVDLAAIVDRHER